MQQATQRQVVETIQQLAIQDKEQAAFLLESFAIELARTDRKATIPLSFASFSPEDGLLLIRNRPVDVIEIHVDRAATENTVTVVEDDRITVFVH